MMGGIEDYLILHANAGEVVGIEKAAVVDVVGGYPPIGEAEGLRLDKFVKFFEACGIGGVAIDQVDCSTNEGGDLGRSGTELSQAALINLLVSVALGDAIAFDFLPSG
jgi:hypothetical protein